MTSAATETDPSAVHGSQAKTNPPALRSKSPAKRATVHTLGCRLNQTEAFLIRQRLEHEGYEIVPFDEPADLAIINTCTVTNLADAKSRQAIRGFTRRNPQAFTAVVGCYSQSGARHIARIPGVDLIVGNQNKLEVLDFVGSDKNEHPVIIRDRINRSDFGISFVGDAPFDKRANLKIQDGCDFMCSFCIIPFVRGRGRSRELDNLVAEAESLAGRGVRELVLTGVNIGTYDHRGANIVDVVDALADVTGIDRLRISSIEPTTVPGEVLDRMADRNHPLLPFLHLPLQSGCDRILREMRRRYSVTEYLDFARHAHARIEDLYLGTDIMVAFPGETSDEFEQTCALFMREPFAFCHVFTYSERSNTPAAARGDQVPIPERQRRSARLRRLAAANRHGFYLRHLGREVPVLFEDPTPDSWPGYTDNYVRVVIDADQAPGQNLANRRCLVRLVKIEADVVVGSLVSVFD